MRNSGFLKQSVVFIMAIAAAGFIQPHLTSAQRVPPEKTEWITGPSLDQHLLQPISAAWADVPFKSRLISFAQQQRIAIFVDRRLDPGTPISIALRDVTVEQFLWAIAENQNWGVCRLDDFYYLGPADTAAALPILWRDLAGETHRGARKFDVDWNAKLELNILAYSNPADVLSQISAVHHFEIVGSGLPHDRWPAMSLPANSVDKMVALLAVGFGKWIERSSDGVEVKLVDFPEPESGTVEFEPLPNGRELLADLRKRFPDCRLSSTSKTFRVSGSPKQIAAVRSELVAAQRPAGVVGAVEKQFTLTTRASRGDILATIAQQTGNHLEFEPECSELLKQSIALSVKQVPLSKLVEKTLEGTGLSYQIHDGKLEITQ